MLCLWALAGMMKTHTHIYIHTHTHTKTHTHNFPVLGGEADFLETASHVT